MLLSALQQTKQSVKLIRYTPVRIILRGPTAAVWTRSIEPIKKYEGLLKLNNNVGGNPSQSPVY
jgi:hypothetical protein